jgi:2-dehydro-3-deoxygalactonokinase
LYIATIDCGTTNTRVYIVDENANVITHTSQKVGVRNTAISGSNQILKDSIHQLFNSALNQAEIKASEIRCIMSSGVITSELGLLEIPHLVAPCNIKTLAEKLMPFQDESVFPKSIPVYLVPGIKNPFDPKIASIKDVGILDSMRGEETQVAGLLDNPENKLPCIFTMLSSHTKYIPIDENKNILGGVTTLSGQLYETLLQESVVGKSIKSEDDYDDSNYFDPEVVNIANHEIMDFGFLRGLMSVRFLDILLHTPWYERKLFAESILAAEDMRALQQIQTVFGLESSNFILIGKHRRCRIYEHLILQMKADSNCHISMIDNEAKIDQLCIRGALSLAKQAGVL